MSGSKLAYKGFVYIFFYVIACAISNVFVNHTTRVVSPIVSLFYSSIFTILFFSVLNLKELSQNIKLIKENKTSILILNFFNAVIWLVIFFSLKELSPAVFSCLFLGAIPIHIFLLELKNSKLSKKNYTIATLLLIIFMLMLLLVFQDVEENNYYQIIKYGALVVVVGGIVGAFIMKISKTLAIKNMSASLVVSLRFYGLLLLSFLLLILNPSQFLVEPEVLGELFLLSLVSMALPLFLLQKALKTISPLFASIIITIIPVLTYFLQLMTGYYIFSLVKLSIIMLFALCLTVLAYVKTREQ